MIFLRSVHFNGVYQAFWAMYSAESSSGTLPSQHYNNNLLKIWCYFILQHLHNVCKQICFSGFKYYHNPKHSEPYTAGRRGTTAPLEKTIFTKIILRRIFMTFFRHIGLTAPNLASQGLLLSHGATAKTWWKILRMALYNLVPRAFVLTSCFWEGPGIGYNLHPKFWGVNKLKPLNFNARNWFVLQNFLYLLLQDKVNFIYF
jgi:hypothetical protein